MAFRVGRDRGQGSGWVVTNTELKEDVRTLWWRLEAIEVVENYDQTCDTGDDELATEEDEIVVEP